MKKSTLFHQNPYKDNEKKDLIYYLTYFISIWRNIQKEENLNVWQKMHFFSLAKNKCPFLARTTIPRTLTF